MRLLADECCHVELVKILRDHGHDVVYIAEAQPSIVDTDVLSLATSLSRVLVTDDKDFGELTVRRMQPSCGVVLLRTVSIDPAFEAKHPGVVCRTWR
jgi:predicted nuclease of predicted toxin-antitoxin system